MKIVAKLAFIAFGLLLTTSDCCKYEKFTKDHSFCKEPNKNCDFQESRVTEEDKNIVLKKHNEYRLKIATGNETRLPKASNMMEMEWDDELASVAQKLANQCKLEHDCNACRRVDRFPVGQNLFSINLPAENKLWAEMTDDFYAEVKDFDKSDIKPFIPSSAYGHFTQVVWATSWLIGCGVAVYKEDGTTHSLFVCNYGPSGNIVGAEMYEEGEPCSDCTSGTCCGQRCREFGVTSNYNGLCKVHNKDKLKLEDEEHKEHDTKYE